MPQSLRPPRDHTLGNRTGMLVRNQDVIAVMELLIPPFTGSRGVLTCLIRVLFLMN